MPDDQMTHEPSSFEPMFATIAEDSAVMPSSPRQVIQRPQVAAPGFRSAPAQIAHHIAIETAYWRVHSSVSHQAHTRFYPFAKRTLDLALTIPALILLSPLLLSIAILVRLDSPGPALFKQERVGQNGRFFTMYKFRSMTDGAGVRVGRIHKLEKDNRVTRVGRILRKTSLDELPQLFNVVLGHMSLVGPRPELPQIMLEHYEPWQYKRLSVPQGITGWWQVTGRGRKLLWKHTRDDLYYVERASIWFDLKLLLMTIRAVLSRDGAF